MKNLKKLYLVVGIMMLTQILAAQTFHKLVGPKDMVTNLDIPGDIFLCFLFVDMYTSTDVCEWGFHGDAGLGYNHYPDLAYLPDDRALMVAPVFRSGLPPGVYFNDFFYNGDPTFLTNEEGSAFYFLSQHNEFYSGPALSIGTSNKETIYFVADTIRRIYHNRSSGPVIGVLPPDLQNPRAITFRQNEFVMALPHAIARLDTLHPENSHVLFELPDNFPLIDGLVTLNYEDGRSITYAVANYQWYKGTNIYEVDFDRQELIKLCSFEGYEDFIVTGMSSSDEWKILESPVTADLDGPSTSRIDFSPPPTCNFRQYITDTLVHLYARRPIDSVKVAIHGNFNTTIEQLTFQNTSGIQIQSDQPGQLLLINEGSATAEDFEAALQGIWYEHQLVTSFPITKKIDVTLYADTLVSETAQSTLKLGVDHPVQITHSVDSVTCFGGSNGRAALKIPHGSAPFSFQWLDGSDLSVREDLSAGQYVVTVTDAGGCTGLDTLEVFAPEIPLTLSIEIPQNPVCEGAGSLIATVSGGAEPYRYAWSNGDTVAHPAGLSAGTYELSLTDTKGCEALATASLEPRPTFRHTYTVAICEGGSYEYEGLMLQRDTLICDTIRVDNACDSLFCFELQVRPVFERSMEASICHGETFEFYGSLLSQDTSLCITRRAPNGCDSTICLNLKVLRPQSEWPAQICRGQSYSWRGRQFSEPGLYADTIENRFGCDSVLLLRLEYVQLPELKIEQAGSFCAGDDEVRLSVTDQFDTYLWSNGERSAETLISRPGRYFVIGYDENKCYTTDTIDITEIGISEIKWITEDPTCFGYSDGSFTIRGIRGGRLPLMLSINDEPFRQTWRALDLAAGDYKAIVEDAVGCRKEVRFRLNDPPEPYIDLPMDISIGLGDSVLLEPATNLQTENILWTPSDYLSCDDCLMPVASPVQSIIYQLEISDTTGCRAQADIQINVNRRASLFVPNTFSPNGDGINDELIPFGGNSVAQIKLFRVFDRWGNLLFERKDFLPGQAGWNGRARGEEVPKGIYIYHLEVERIDGESEIITGDVVLLR